MAPIQRWQAQQYVIVFQCTGNAILGAVNGVENSEEGQVIVYFSSGLASAQLVGTFIPARLYRIIFIRLFTRINE